jgi:thiamine-phosphate pyrophosphorylase
VSTGFDLSGRRLYLCTPDRPDLESFLVACMAGGVDVVQLRDKVLEARPLLARARLAASVCRDHGVPFVLNDRPDLALEAGADGVHVGQDDAPVSLARRILGPAAIVGLSTHAPDELEAACAEDVTYLSAGPVEATPTKPGRPGTGVEYVRRATARSSVPVFVTGGVTPERIPRLAAAGVRHFVVVRFLTEAPDPRRAARELRDTIDRALGDPPPSGRALGDRDASRPGSSSGPGAP